VSAVAAKYGRIWLRTASMAMQAQLTYRLGSFGFLLGKMMRLLFFFAFVVAVFSHVESVAGYSLVETALFFLTFNLVDMAAQILFRGVYGARRTVAEGDFDFYLIQPCSPLFRMVCSTVDFLDLLTIVPVLVMTGMVFARLPPLPWTSYALYGLLLVNAVVLIFAVHVGVAALAVRTQELESAIWIYRDVMFMGKFPVDVYAPAVRWDPARSHRGDDDLPGQGPARPALSGLDPLRPGALGRVRGGRPPLLARQPGPLHLVVQLIRP
jgi:ABC-type uncharacterized transport system permease subunit